MCHGLRWQRYMIGVHSSVVERQKAGRAAHALCHTRCIRDVELNCFMEHLPCHMPFAALHRLSGSFQAPGQRLLYKTLDTTAMIELVEHAV